MMIRIIPKSSAGCAVIIALCTLFAQACFAQQPIFNPRENAIFVALNRELAMSESLKKAQGKILENRLIREKKITQFLSEITKHTHFYVNRSLEYDNNVDSTQHEKKGSIINTVTPGLKMNFVQRGRSLNIEGNLLSTVYNNRRRSNLAEGDIKMLLNLGIDRYTLTFSEGAFTNRVNARAFAVETERLQYYWLATTNLFLGRQFNRYGFNTGYTHATYYYDHSPGHLSNRFEDVYSFNQSFRLATKTKLLFDYGHGLTKYQHRPDTSAVEDYNYDSYSLGLTSALSYKISGLLRVGYLAYDYKNLADYRDLSFSTNVGYRISGRSDVALSYSHLIHIPPSDITNYSVGDSVGLSANHRFAFNPKISARINFGIDFDALPKTDLYTDRTATYGWGGGLNYAFRKWLDFDLSFADTDVHSNYSTKLKARSIMFVTEAKF